MIYLDNAATTFPKPVCVTAEVQKCLCEYCGNPGRGAHPLAMACAERIYECRAALSDFLGLGAPERILFTHNTTYALNLALKGFLGQGDHVLISELEHNAVRRPLHALQQRLGLCVESFPVLHRSRTQIVEDLARLRRSNTAAVICTHASNICSVSLPLAPIGAFCRKHGIRFIVDAAQSAGHLPIDMRAMRIDALAAPAHKALFGIQGAGVLALGENFMPNTIIEGGSGHNSLLPDMPSQAPERFEAGTLPTPSIVALAQGLKFIARQGLEFIHEQERCLFFALRERLEALAGITIYERERPGSVLLFNHGKLPPNAVAEHLGQHDICVRAGYHCAPLAHAALGTPEGGAVRVSFGPFNTVQELDTLFFALREL